MSYKGFIIVESPAKARTLQKYVGKDYLVKASMGHVIDLPKNRIGVDVKEGFTPKYITIAGKEKIIKELKDSLKESENVYLATDPDREGEAIAWHLARALGLPMDKPTRIELHEITPEALHAALTNSRVIDEDRVNAQQARRILDRLVGYKLSPVLWKKVTAGLSAGRVQSVAVRLIVERQKEIEAFVSEEYWTVSVILENSDPYSVFKANLLTFQGKKISISDEKTAFAIKDFLLSEKFYVSANPEKKKYKKEPPLPYITSTLQQDASRRLGFKVAKTMKVAQQLFEGLEIGDEGPVGLITYMRTDSTRISDGSRQEAVELIEKKFGEKFIGKPRVHKKKAGTQDAHEAIRPTNVLRDMEMLRKILTPEQYRLYSLIRDRFLASQMAPCELESITLHINCGDYAFSSQGTSVVFPGFTRIYSEIKEEKDENEEETTLLNLPKGTNLNLKSVEPKQHFTQPPPNYTEASLVKALEKNGIGRPSTYAPIVETIQKREYVKLTDKKFIPTKLGNVVTELLVKNFPTIVDIAFTATLEGSLDKIEEGSADMVNILSNFYEPFIENLNKVEKLIERVESSSIAEETDEQCEKCNSPMIIKRGPYGKFLACSAYPECKSTKPYFEKIGIPCPKCTAGSVIQKRGKKAIFYGCDRYPECDFTSWYRPLDKKCPSCESVMVLKYTKGGKGYTMCINDCKGILSKKREEKAESSETNIAEDTVKQKNKTKSSIKTESKADSKTESKADSKAKSKAESKTESKADSKAKSKAESKTKSKAGAKKAKKTKNNE